MRGPKWILISLLCLATSILPGCSDSTTPATTPPPTATKNYLYAVNASANTITAWQIGASDGSLTPVTSPTAVFDAPVAATIDPASKFIAVVNRNGGTLNVLVPSSTSGTLSEVAGSPFLLAPTGGYEFSPVFDPIGDYLYICDSVFTNSISVYAVDASGKVDFSDTFPVANSIYSLAIIPSAGYLYAFGTGISAFKIDLGGLTELTLSPFMSSLALANAKAVISPNGKFLLIADRDRSQLRIVGLNPDGTVGSDAAGSPLTLSAQPMAIATNSTGTVAVVTTDAETVIAVPFDAVSGALGTPGTAVATGHLPRSVVFDLQDKFVYVGNQNSGTVSGFVLGSGASLTPVPGSPYTAGADTIELITTRFSSP